jgi:hypothetical protein
MIANRNIATVENINKTNNTGWNNADNIRINHKEDTNIDVLGESSISIIVS